MISPCCWTANGFPFKCGCLWASACIHSYTTPHISKREGEAKLIGLLCHAMLYLTTCAKKQSKSKWIITRCWTGSCDDIASGCRVATVVVVVVCGNGNGNGNGVVVVCGDVVVACCMVLLAPKRLVSWWTKLEKCVMVVVHNQLSDPLRWWLMD